MFDEIYLQFVQNIELLKPFESQPKIAIAFSGGIDSSALLLLTKRWLDQIGGTVVAITVNHNLRPSSLDEANAAGAICNKLGVEHVILNWHSAGIASNIQAQAREARYMLLTQYCADNGIIHLFTGHHMDDAIENFFIKLSRGSGIFGLAQSHYNFINNVRICKPMFNISKSQCEKILLCANLAHINDPSNTNLDYFRNEIRHNLEQFFNFKSISSSLFKDRIIRSVNALSDSAKIVQKNLISALSNCVSIFSAGFAKLDLSMLKNYEQDIQLYILTYLLTIISGTRSGPRAKQIQEILLHIQDTAFTACVLNKCIIARTQEGLIIYKELINITKASSITSNRFIWDGRFHIRINTNAIDIATLKITTLDSVDYKNIRDNINLNLINDAKKHMNKILFTLPVIKSLEKVVSIPNIDYYNGLCKSDIMSFFEPLYVSKIIHLNI